MQDSLQKHLYQLEERLLEPKFRRQRTEVGSLLADDFREFGSSGRAYNKRQILEAMEHAPDHNRRTIVQFEIKILAPDVALTLFEVARVSDTDEWENFSLRSSIWQLREGRWQMTFHQGTLTKSD